MKDSVFVDKIYAIVHVHKANIAKKGEALSDCDYHCIAINAVEEALDEYMKEFEPDIEPDDD
jgi:hypothetical protein